MVKHATPLFNSFCSNVAKQVARFLLPVLLLLEVTLVLIFTHTLTVILIVFLDWSYDRNADDGMFLLFRSIG